LDGVHGPLPLEPAMDNGGNWQWQECNVIQTVFKQIKPA